MVGLLTRRGALGGGATVGLLAALGLGSCAVGGTSPAFAAAVSALAAARRREDEHEERVLAPALAAFKRAIDAVPHRRTTQSFVNAFDEVRTLSTEDDVVVGSAQRFMTWSDIETFDPDWVAAHRELIVLADDRNAECRRIRTEHRIDALHKEASHLSGLSGAALEAVLDTPAVTITDLVAKMQFIEDEEVFDESAHAAIFADVRRLAGVA